MRTYLFAIFAVASFIISVPARAAPLETYGQLPTLEQVIISPDGGKLAYVRPRGAGRSILIQDLTSQAIVGGVDLGTKKLRDVSWVGPGHLLITTSQTAIPSAATVMFYSRQETFQARIYDVAKRSFLEVLGKEPGTTNYLFSDPKSRVVDGAPSVYAEGMRVVGGEAYETLFRIDAVTGMTRAVEAGPREDGIQTAWTLDAQGGAIAKTEYDVKSGAWRLLVKAAGRWRPIQTGTFTVDRPYMVGLGPKPATLIVARTEDERLQYRQVSLVDGSWGEPLEVEEDVDFISDAKTRQIIGYVTGEERLARFFDPKDQAAWARLARAFPNERISLQSWSDDRKKLVVQVQGAKTGNAYMLVDLAAGSASIVDDVYAGLTAGDISVSRWMNYKAADGLDLQAVLTLPVGRPAKALPLVVLPHGGPEAHDDLSFDWWAQALASRGYAVLQPNFRGSSGYGGKFRDAGHGEWGRKMQTDVSDGVRHLATEGVIDPKRVCIAGASYGGYAALAGVTLEQGVYRCAVAVAGVSDLRRMLTWQRSRAGGEHADLRYWRRFMGADRGAEEVLDAYSPAKLAQRADAPILLIHGKDDTVVAYEQSLVMSRALEAASKKVELVTLPSEDHWLSRGETRLKMLAATVAFLETHNPPR